MRRALLFCAAIAFAIACGDSVTEPVPDRTPSTPPVSFSTSTSDDGLLSITTDKDDYSPGDTVHFTGTGWEPGPLDILLVDDSNDRHSWSVTVAEDGTFHDSTYVVDTRDFGVTFTLTATSPSGASLTVTFTDGRAITSVTLNGAAKATVASGAAITAVVQGQLNGNNNNTLGSIGVAVRPDGSSSSTPFVQLTCFDVNPDEGPSTPSNTIPFSHTFSFNAPANATSTAAIYDVTVTSYSDNTCATAMGAFQFDIDKGITVQAAAVASTTTISASPVNAQTFGLSVTFTAQVKKSSDNSAVGTGTVRFYDGGNSCSDLGSAAQIGGDQAVTSGQAQISTSGLSVSPPAHTIRACYLANSSFNASEASLSYTINPALTGTALAVDPATGAFAGTADLKATLMAGSSAVPGKTISFKLNGTAACGVSGKPSCPVTDASGVAELPGASLAGINVGTYPGGVTANFAGDATHALANGSATLTVNQADQTIDFPAVGPFTFGAQTTFQVAATATSNLTVSFTTQTSDKCTVTGTTVTIKEAGTCTIRASQGGNSNYKPAPNVDQDIVINKADQTITFGALGNKTFGDLPFTVSATASSELAVTFALGAGSVGCSVSGNTVTIISATGPGESCTIVAKQGGNVNYNPAPDVSRSFTIAKAPTTTSITTVSPSPAIFGQQVTVNFTVAPKNSGSGYQYATSPSGNVDVKDASDNVLCTGTVATGNCKFYPAGAGTVNLTASYQGDGNFLASSSSPATSLTVNKASTSITISVSPSPATYGEQVTVSFTVAPQFTGTPTGTVHVKQASTEVCSAGTTAGSCTFYPGGAGSLSLTADYDGDNNFLGSQTAAATSLTVNKAPTSSTLSLSSGPYIIHGSVMATFTVAPKNTGSGYQYAVSPTGTVNVVNGTTQLCSPSPTLPATTCNFTLANVGTYNVTSSYIGDGNFLPSTSVAVSISVNYIFDGLFAPVDRLPTMNSAKAGQAIPLKWRLTDANNLPILNFTQADVAVTIKAVTCDVGGSLDQIEEYAGNSGLQNLGDGYYQFNWKTPTSYATTCKQIGLNLGEAIPRGPLANFTFKK